MRQTLLDRDVLTAFLDRLDDAFGRPGRLYLVGEATPVYEGWAPWTAHLTYAADVRPEDRLAFTRAVRAAQAALGVEAHEESPADVVPLPDGYDGRHRPAGGPERRLAVYHFDPYSVAFRYLARGDEPDYHLVLAFLAHGWMTEAGMDALLAGLLPRFTCETIQQDPAEFRRKYKGLRQMWRARRSHPVPHATTVP